MRAYVIIATKGRRLETTTLAGFLASQSLKPAVSVFVGAGPDDIDEPALIGALGADQVKFLYADRPGLTIQRNLGLSALPAEIAKSGDGFVAFFDDDFRPASTWLEAARDLFVAEPGIAGLTGCVIADGVKGQAITEDEALAFIGGALPAQKHWASGDDVRDLSSAYGCNMAFRTDVALACTFDERLPLYGWQEDRDFTGQALKHGRVVYTPACRGVHLGVKGARTNGKRLGYSQVANLVYLHRKGTVASAIMTKFVSRSLAANLYGTAFRSRHPGDYAGRLRGNAQALFDLARHKCDPENILRM